MLPDRKNNGFTLLEIMVAVSIIAIVSTAVYQMHFFSLSESHRAGLEARCLLLAQQKLAEMSGSTPDLLQSEAGDFGEAHPDFRWKVQVDPAGPDILKGAGRDLKRIDITVFSGRDTVFYTLRAYRFCR